jgi:NhaC family Na+:H+ antiporter
MSDTLEMITALHDTFNITPWALIIPAITITMIVLRVPTITTLAVSAIMGAIGVFLFQSQMLASVMGVITSMWSGFESNSGLEAVDSLATTDGILGMMPVVYLVVSALIFGWMMISSGMLATLSDAITSKLRRRTSIIASTLGAGIVLNACTADQYLSLIIDGNMFRNIYRRSGFDDRMLSRTIEDGVSVTSVLIPWSSCGVTQATVLGVSTLTYLPYCVFNYLTPVMSMVMIWTNYKIRYIVAPQKVARE